MDLVIGRGGPLVGVHDVADITFDLHKFLADAL